MTALALARARWQEASRVKDAYSAMVVKRRTAWRNAAAGKDADRARRNLQHAVDQLTAASAQERAAWRDWHALG